jgi:GntR family transcriptional regulator
MAETESEAPSDAPLPPPGNGVPRYRRIRDQLMAALARGEWRPGEAIPAEPLLARRFGVSIGTLRKAVDELCAANILSRQQGRGTFVTTHDRNRNLFYFFHVVPEDAPKAFPGVALLAFARGRAEREVAERLRIAVGDPVLRIRNRLTLGGVAVVVDDLTLPAARFPGLTERRFRDRPSTIYNLYQEAFGISVVRTRERLRAVRAEAPLSALLGVRPGAPLLQVRRVAYAYRDEPVEYRVSLVNTAHHEYYAEIDA